MPRRKRNSAQVADTTAAPVPKATRRTSKTAKADNAATKKRDSKAEAKKKADDADKKTKDKKADKVDDEEEKEELVERKAVMSNGVMVDYKVPNPGAYEVVTNAGKALNCNLMFADCGHNNNKFYIFQGLKNGSNYYLFTRWGRVGVDGQNAMQPIGSEIMLINTYNKKVGQKRSKGYTEIEISYDEVEDTAKKVEKEEKKKNKKPKKASELDDSVQNLLRFIFDMKMIEKSVVKVGFNIKKLPLGKLSKNTITKGYSVLKQIETELNGRANKDTLSNLSSEFYRHIPHDFKFQHMSNFIINTMDKLKEKLKLVEALGDIQIAAEIMNEIEDADDDLNELDAQYKKMKCSIVPLEPNDQRYDDLMKCVTTTHGSTHGFGIKPLEIFEIKREGEEDRFNDKIGNRKLLWHGSRFSNWGGILSQGLRIAPPEAPVTGYMFGKGVYFADIVSKSAQYCCSYLSNNEGLLAL
jgi:poly [ADP-ribose] polymerase 2/3/4